MNDYDNKGGVGVAVAILAILILLGGGAYLFATHGSDSNVAVEPTPGATPGSDSMSDYFCYAGVCTWQKTYTCNTATSTLFSVANPAGATSTVSVFMIGTGNATSTTFSIGTTTKSSGLALTDISPTLVNGALIGTSSPQFSLMSGVNGVVGSGQIAAGSNTFTEVLVGPSERIGGFGTSTYATTGNLNYVGTLSACRIVVRARR